MPNYIKRFGQIIDRNKLYNDVFNYTGEDEIFLNNKKKVTIKEGIDYLENLPWEDGGFKRIPGILHLSRVFYDIKENDIKSSSLGLSFVRRQDEYLFDDSDFVFTVLGYRPKRKIIKRILTDNRYLDLHTTMYQNLIFPFEKEICLIGGYFYVFE